MYSNEEVNTNKDGDTTSTKGAVINYIVANFYRFINNPNTTDNKVLLTLIAALGIVNASDDPAAIGAARRLAQNALTRNRKK